jgi:hypothetical protein
MFVGGLTVTALCLWGTGIVISPASPPNPRRLLMLWVGAFFFGVCTFTVGRDLFDVREQVVVDERGILFRKWSETPIPWHEIARIEVTKVKLNRFLSLWLHHPEAYPSSRLVMGWLARLGGRMRHGDMSVTMIGLDRSFADLVEAVEQHWPDIGR